MLKETVLIGVLIEVCPCNDRSISREKRRGFYRFFQPRRSPFVGMILSVSRSLYKKNRAKMLLMTFASVGLAACLCTTAYGQCNVEKGEFYLLGADPVTLYYGVELRDVAQSKAIENFDEKSTDDSDYYFPNPTVCVVKEKVASYVGHYRILI